VFWVPKTQKLSWRPPPVVVPTEPRRFAALKIGSCKQLRAFTGQSVLKS
jgi:hypothetical protein